LRSRSDELLAQVPTRAKAIAAGKNFALLEHYIKKLNWPDDKLIKKLQAETVSMSFSWYARVPAHSNPGDGPSRLRLTHVPDNLFANCIAAPSDELIIQLAEAIGKVLDSGKCMRPMAANLRGRMQYASNQIFGRVALSLLAELSQHQFHSSSPFISVELREALVWFRVLILTERPRTLSLLGERKPVFIFSDGACEGDRFNNVTVGAVLFDAANGTKEMFGCSICKEVVDFWKSDSPDKDQTIAQAEILPAILSRVIWRRYLLHRRVVFCLDNDSARLSLIKGTSASPSSRILIRSNLQAETVSMSFSWYARVPTHSNPGDGPSRLQLIPGPENLFATCVNAPPDDLIIQLAISGTLPAFT
jgi:hypothetical protein